MNLASRTDIIAHADACIAKCRAEITRRSPYTSQGRTVATLRVELRRRTWRERQVGVVIDSPPAYLTERTFCWGCRHHTTAWVTQAADVVHAGCIYCGRRLNDQLEMERLDAQPVAGWGAA